MKKNILFMFFILLPAVYSFSSDLSTVKLIKGTVEIKKDQTGWVKAEEGMKLSPGTMISTGFKSNAVIELDNSEIFIKPLTRIRIDSLSKSGNTVKTNLNLKLGRITANVKTSKGLKHDFTLKTPVSTAAVRGTVFTSGVRTLDVESGSIRYSNNLGQQVTVLGGTSSHMGITGFSAPPDMADAIEEAFNVATSTGADDIDDIVNTVNSVIEDLDITSLTIIATYSVALP